MQYDNYKFNCVYFHMKKKWKAHARVAAKALFC